MTLLKCIFIIGILFLYAKLVHTSDGITKCQCTCCNSTTGASCNYLPSSSVILKTDQCQMDACMNACQRIYTDCQLGQGIIRGKCISSSR